MECSVCRKKMDAGEKKMLHLQWVCEDCYIDSVCRSKPICDPWAEYLSTRSATDDGKESAEMKDRKLIELLLKTALELGATDAARISVKDIEIKDELAALCETPRCENFGTSFKCPPHVSGPEGFRERIKSYDTAIVFKITVPSEILLSHQRVEIFRLLHMIAVNIEENACKMGYTNSKAYAGGSCKMLFCNDHLSCNVLSGNGKCRNPEKSRPSMSGYGIDVSKLMKNAGWEMEPSESAMKSVCGMILIG